jgi:Ser/Thr protein kinase RdoA (MazF antagonist)
MEFIINPINTQLAEKIFSKFYSNLGKHKSIKHIDNAGINSYQGHCFLIETAAKDKYILKFSKNFKNYKELYYLFRVVKEARRRGFNKISDIIATDQKKAGTIESSGRSFILYEFKDGKLFKEFDYPGMGNFLAEFHNAVYGLKQNDPRMESNNIINIDKQMQLLNNALNNGNINFEDYNCILSHIGYFQDNFFKKSYKLKKIINHSDFNNRNVLKTGDKFTGLIDLDDLHHDVRILDLSKAILHNPSIKNLTDFVKEYNKYAVEKLTKDEILALPEIWRYRLIKMLIWAVSSPEKKTIRELSSKERNQFDKMTRKDYNNWLVILKKFDSFNWDRFCQKWLLQL